jgi:plastocyanin
LLPLLAGGLLTLIAGCGDDEPMRPSARTIDVEAFDFFFQPVAVNARVGDTIRFTQRGEIPHTATSGEPGVPDAGSVFDLQLQSAGDSMEFVTSQAGTIPFFCRPHPFMTGSITVAP